MAHGYVDYSGLVGFLQYFSTLAINAIEKMNVGQQGMPFFSPYLQGHSLNNDGNSPSPFTYYVPDDQSIHIIISAARDNAEYAYDLFSNTLLVALKKISGNQLRYTRINTDFNNPVTFSVSVGVHMLQETLDEASRINFLDSGPY